MSSELAKSQVIDACGQLRIACGDSTLLGGTVPMFPPREDSSRL